MARAEVEPVENDFACIPANMTAESDPDGRWVRLRRRVCFNANSQTCTHIHRTLAIIPNLLTQHKHAHSI